MLVLSRKVSEQIYIGDDVCVTVQHVGNGRVKIGVSAPEEMRILRGELHHGDLPRVPEAPLPTHRAR
ncbi:MAG: carbon storage regulator [bacterium]|nr:carbon storage regulator [bacterium]